jgi:L-2,4-diaminobutyrate decarboxylase
MTPNDRLAAAYDGDLLREVGHLLADKLADQFSRASNSAGPVLPWRDPPENIRDARAELSRSSQTCDREALLQRVSELFDTMLARGHNLHDPRYIGHQVPAPVPIAGLFDAVGAVTNQPMAVYEMGPWATAVEHAMVAELGERLGWQPDSFGGLVTHGGSLANLTALLTARNLSLPNSWRDGLPAGATLVVQGDAHYSIARVAGMLGIGSANIHRVPLDAKRRMRPDALAEILCGLRNSGRPIVAVCACACATPIGAFDPLPEIAAICREHEVWLHVDAAHGAAACLSPRHRHLVAGLELADSVVWDAHKMLFVPALCAFVLYRQREHAYAAFRQDAPYLFDPSAPGLAAYDSGLRTVECTKRAAVFGLWGIWSVFGPELFADLVDRVFAVTRNLYDSLCAAPDFEPLHEPECNIQVFRYLPDQLCNASAEEIGAYQLKIRRALVESGEFYIVSTKIDGIGALRATVINPLTEPSHCDALLQALRHQSPGNNRQRTESA